VKRASTASTIQESTFRCCLRQVSTTVSNRSTNRLPSADCVPAQQAAAPAGGGEAGRPRRPVRRCGALRVRPVPGLPVVPGAAVRAGAIGPQALQRAGGAGRRHAPGDSGSNHAYINAESVCALLREVAVAGLARPITLVLDNARYQKCQLVEALALSLGIELLYLPPYSPNLNLIERLWKLVKQECLGCRVLPTYEAFAGTIDECLASINTRHRHQTDTLLNLEFQLFDEDVPVLSA
jgi:hypothetical protein